ncbi:hypothetical protein K4K59_013345 [Colletotrichum sp. SAR11_240]|nr:hypothetical protein K4K59_013345 [Colletotrichum sp. SAR11_240]
MSIASLDRPLKLSALAFHLFGRTLEGIEAFDKDVRKDQKADFTWMIFMVSAQYAACYQLAEGSTRYVDSLVSCTLDYLEVSSEIEMQIDPTYKGHLGIDVNKVLLTPNG